MLLSRKLFLTNNETAFLAAEGLVTIFSFSQYSAADIVPESGHESVCRVLIHRIPTERGK